MTISISSPEAAIAATPYLLGFQPHDSLVLLLSHHDGLHMTMRVDLPDRPEVEWLQVLLNGIPEPLPGRAVVMAYADAVSPDEAAAIADWIALVLMPMMDVADVLLVDDGRVYSRMCTDPGCCDPCGLSVVELREHPIVAQCIAAGMGHLPDRMALRSQLAEVKDEVAEQAASLLAEPLVGAYEQIRDQLEQQALQILCGHEDVSAADIAGLARACADIHVRDPLIRVLLERRDIATVRLPIVRTRLTYALTRLSAEYAGPVAATLAVLAWADGDGASALVACDRACEADPANTLAPLVAHALQYGLPPTTWFELTQDIPMDVLRGRYRPST